MSACRAGMPRGVQEEPVHSDSFHLFAATPLFYVPVTFFFPKRTQLHV